MNEQEIRILKIDNCPSLSKRSTLTYHIGCIGKDIYVRLFQNSHGGLFSKEWLSIEHLGITENLHISSSSLHTILKGSVNTSGFMMAILLNEGLIKLINGKTRSYSCCDPTAFTRPTVAIGWVG